MGFVVHKFVVFIKCFQAIEGLIVWCKEVRREARILVQLIRRIFLAKRLF